ncbi:hypothetical protein F2Q69_00000167 [Brassica cretica]|uniref:EF-hand domain-containing protein n=1 Tax=Brassica cretica TaxID=69181 RepID=A0A8S9NZY9_BRACR|nr:hypothetical protein F2Q69_00000167 [Brassica cretica]
MTLDSDKDMVCFWSSDWRLQEATQEMSGYPPTSQGYGYSYGGGGNQPPPPYPSGGGSNPPYGSSTSSSPYPRRLPHPRRLLLRPTARRLRLHPAPPPHDPSGYAAAPRPGYGPPPKHGPSDYGSYGAPPPRPAQSSYGAAPPQGVSEYGGYGAVPPPRPASSGHGGVYGGYTPPQGSYGSPFASLIPSGFAPGTDPNIVACFHAADQDGSGFIDDKELQGALSSYQQRFSMRTVHLLIYLFTNTNAMKIGPKEFTALFYSLQNWRSIFERSDKDRSGRIDVNELRDALLSLGFSVSPVILDLLVSKFDKSGGKNRAIEYDNFIECCLTVKGLTEKFKEKDTGYSGSATFTYESFMLTVLPFLIA